MSTGEMTDRDVLAGLWMLVRVVAFAVLLTSALFAVWTLSGFVLDDTWHRVYWCIGVVAIWVSLVD